jgi:hypothetical protein
MSNIAHEPEPKLRYHSPRLEFFGHVASLTRGTFSTKNDTDMTKTKEPIAFGPGSADEGFTPEFDPWLEN